MSKGFGNQKRGLGRLGVGLLLLPLFLGEAGAQSGYTWDQVKAKFEASNPTLKADANNVDELKAEEITAFLRPNPQLTLSQDGTAIAPYNGHWQPTKGTQGSPSVSYLHERDHKRELRLKTAQEATQIGGSLHEDLERNMLFGLRSAFVQTLEAKAVLDLARAPVGMR